MTHAPDTSKKDEGYIYLSTPYTLLYLLLISLLFALFGEFEFATYMLVCPIYMIIVINYIKLNKNQK